MASILTFIKSTLTSSEPRWTLLPTSSPPSPSSPSYTEKPTLTRNPFHRTLSGRIQLPSLKMKIRINRVRTTVLRILVGCVVVTCVSMVFALSGMTAHTVKKLGVHFDSDAVWRGFPVMMGYYNGIYEIVPKEVNVAENTGPNNAPKASPPSPALYKRFTTRSSSTDKPQASKSKSKKKVDGKKDGGKKAPKPVLYHPYPDYQTLHPMTFKSCETLVSNYTGVSPRIKAYQGVPRGMPDPFYGSYEALGLDDTVCFERRTRFGGYGWKDRDEIPRNAKDEGVLFDREWKVDWRQVQETCKDMNSERFYKPGDKDGDNDVGKKDKKEKKARTAVVLRVWDRYPFTRFDYVVIRSLITELNVNTGGEYDVHILMHVQDETVDLRNQTAARKVVEESIAEEFWGIVTVWSEEMMREEYEELEMGVEWREHGIYSAYRSIWLPQQWFSRNHPEYEFFWSLEMDVKYTGHWYHFLDKVDAFAREQPRRGLWARNARFYVPSVHGSYKDFSEMVERESGPEERIWGPVGGGDLQIDAEKTVKAMFETEGEDKSYEWGKGEDADLVTLSPIFEPVNTTWVIKDDFTGYGNERPAKERYNPYWTGPPRRGAVVAVYRFSRRLLEAMEGENRKGRHMGVEMFPASVALQYGLKAVYAPHPVFMDRRWPGRYLEGILNGGRHGSSGGSQKSLFGKREHHFGGSGFYYGSYWPRGLMGVWLGGEWAGKGGEGWERVRGRGCLGGMVLHPVKEL